MPLAASFTCTAREAAHNNGVALCQEMMDTSARNSSTK